MRPNPPEADPRERELFLSALDLPDGAGRREFLDEACRDNPVLRARIGQLLKSHEESGDFLPEDDAFAGAQLRAEAESHASGVTPISTGATGPAHWEPPAPEQLDPLFEPYEIESLIGRGGMGAVYRGIQTSLERPVAIKILRPEISEDPAFAERFRREALAMAKLSHPNLVAIHDYGSVTAKLEDLAGKIDDGRIYYLVMEFIDGTDLYRMIRSGELEQNHVLSLISQICDALEFAHSEGYIHRDIKPANIFVTRSGIVKVGDFGLAKLAGSEEAVGDEANLTLTGFVLGTPNYLAPETMAANAGTLDHRADLYSLGVMFYEMLTGSLPKGAFPLPSQKAATDTRLDEVVMKAMQSERDLRYQRASEIKHDVDEISSGDPRVASDGARRWLVGAAAVLPVMAGLWFWENRFGEQSSPSPDSNELTAAIPSDATIDLPFENSLGMRFVPVRITGGPTGGRPVLFSVWETRVSDYDSFVRRQKGYRRRPLDFEPEDDHPILKVNWEEAVAFCEWLTEVERESGTLGPDARYRLPTDHEWSCAVGIGHKEDPDASPEEKSYQFPADYPWGDEWPPDNRTVNLFGNEANRNPVNGHMVKGQYIEEPRPFIEDYEDAFDRSNPVGSFPANQHGLHDLGGNAMEWCRDWNSVEKRRRVLRGGHFLVYNRVNALSSSRNPRPPDMADVMNGFRCVLDLDPGTDSETSPVSTPALSRTGLLPVPTRDLPDLSGLPRGSVRVWGATRDGFPLSADEASAYDDFVEVQFDGSEGWFGLRANGDVLRWKPGEGLAEFRTGESVAILGRAASANRGEWLSAKGSIVTRGHHDSALAEFEAANPIGIADLAKPYTGEDDHHTVLLSDGSLHYLGSEYPPPTHQNDFVRLASGERTVCGLRENGALVFFGQVTPENPDSSRRYAALTSLDYRLMALTTDGIAMITAGDSDFKPIPEWASDGPFDRIVCGYDTLAARRSDGTWAAFSTNLKEPGAAETVERIEALGPNVVSLAVHLGMIVWIEAKP